MTWANLPNGKRHILITGGAGFIGTNLADRLLSQGLNVIVLDDLSRPGSDKNLEWLADKHGSLLRFEHCDVRNFDSLRARVHGASVVFHFAAQVAVTDSLLRPRHDFDVNAKGTLNLLEAIRNLSHPPVLVYTSTNKVYGALEDLNVTKHLCRYTPSCDEIAKNGISESQSLDFHSPYGCSKGAADQYILDYARTFRLPAVVFRMSCIYGDHQNGTEDQGWVAHFLIRSNEGKPIRIYGDGMQVRDLLHVSDLLNAFELAVSRINETSGQPFNIGGGPQNTVSLLELLELMRKINIAPPQIEFESWRAADQRYYVSDTRKFRSKTGWTPQVCVPDGLRSLHKWLAQDRQSDNFIQSRQISQIAAAS